MRREPPGEQIVSYSRLLRKTSPLPSWCPPQLDAVPSTTSLVLESRNVALDSHHVHRRQHVQELVQIDCFIGVPRSETTQLEVAVCHESYEGHKAHDKLLSQKSYYLKGSHPTSAQLRSPTSAVITGSLPFSTRLAYADPSGPLADNHVEPLATLSRPHNLPRLFGTFNLRPYPVTSLPDLLPMLPPQDRSSGQTRAKLVTAASGGDPLHRRRRSSTELFAEMRKG